MLKSWFDEPICKDKTTLEYSIEYSKRMKKACNEVGITIEQGVKFLEVLYKHYHD